MFRRLGLLVTLCAALSGCGGGGSSSSALPQPPPSAPGAPPAGLQNVSVTITIPAATSTAALARHTLYISSQTKSAAVVVNGGKPAIANLTPGSPNCTQTAAGLACTLSVSAPTGSDTFTVTLFPQTNGAGSALSTGAGMSTVVAGTANTVKLTLNGIIASLALSLAQQNPPQGSPTKIGLTVTAKDAGNAIIIGGDPFTTQIDLSNDDSSGATTFSKTPLLSPADGVGLTVSYSGSSTPIVFSAKSGNVSAPSVTLTPQAPATIHFNDYSTFGYDNQRDVFNPNSTAFTPSTLGNIHLAWQAALGGGDFNTQTQPVLATNVGGHAGVIIVGGGSGRVYGYDALTGAAMWNVPTGQETYTCEGGNTIYFGVGGTAAYDPGSKSIYIVGNNNGGANATASNTLFHIDAASGSLLGQVNFAPALAGWPSLDFSHVSVTLGNNGLAYVGTGATCDRSSWRGRVAAISVPSMQLADTFFPVWDPQNTRGGGAQPWGGGGIWGWGGVSLDFNGNIIAGVGNTDNGTTAHGQIVAPFAASPEESSGLGEALIKLSPDLGTLIESHHPIPQSMISGNSADLDLTGTPTIFQPNGSGCDPMAAVQAKSGTVYLYDALHIGGGVVAQYQLSPSSYNDGFLGNPAYSPVTGLLYVIVSSSNNSLYPPGMVAIDPGCGRPSIAWHSAFGPDSYASGSDINPGYQRTVPAVSAGGVVFVGTACTPQGNGCATTTASAARSTQSVERKPLICCTPSGSGGGAVWALDASTGTVLNNGNPLIITSGLLRMPPTVDGNWLYVLDNAGNLYALTLDNGYKATNTKQRAVDSRTITRWEYPPSSH